MRKTLLVILSLSLVACAKPPKPTPKPSTSENATVALAEAASSVSHSLNKLNATEQAANPPKSISQPPSPASYGMDIPASLNWTGPVEPAVKQLAEAANYRFETLGTPPTMPIIVTISEENSNIGSILRNIGLQCKKRADIVVYPKTHVVELRYLERT